MDRIEGYLEVGTTGHGEVVINHTSQFTPSEIREAALLAVQEDAATRIKSIMLPREIVGVDGVTYKADA